jgi:hypothetical protein
MRRRLYSVSLATKMIYMSGSSSRYSMRLKNKSLLNPLVIAYRQIERAQHIDKREH